MDVALETVEWVLADGPVDYPLAVAAMEDLGHDFYVFANSETEQVNVIYRRKDGNYGLIEPEF